VEGRGGAAPVVSADGRQLDPQALPAAPQASLQTGRLDLSTPRAVFPQSAFVPRCSPGPSLQPVGEQGRGSLLLRNPSCVWNVQGPRSR